MRLPHSFEEMGSTSLESARSRSRSVGSREPDPGISNDEFLTIGSTSRERDRVGETEWSGVVASVPK